MVPVALGLGSNKGFGGRSCLEILGGAVAALADVLEGLEWSSVYKTRAMYYTDQDDFYNMAVLGFAPDALAPLLLLQKTQAIEARFGRDRSQEFRNGPRSLDIDIELFGGQTINAEALTVPHPRLKERAFVLVPIVEILAKDADNIKWKGLGSAQIAELGAACSSLRGQGIAQHLDADAFYAYIKEEPYGTRNVGTNKVP